MRMSPLMCFLITDIYILFFLSDREKFFLSDNVCSM